MKYWTTGLESNEVVKLKKIEMIRKYALTQYVNMKTGEVLIGERRFREYLYECGVTKFSRRWDRTQEIEVRDNVEYVKTTQMFTIEGTMDSIFKKEGGKDGK